MKKQPRKNHRHFDDQIDFEGLAGCVTAYPADESKTSATISTARGLPGRKTQIAILSKNDLGEFIEYLKELHLNLKES